MSELPNPIASTPYPPRHVVCFVAEDKAIDVRTDIPIDAAIAVLIDALKGLYIQYARRNLEGPPELSDYDQAVSELEPTVGDIFTKVDE